MTSTLSSLSTGSLPAAHGPRTPAPNALLQAGDENAIVGGPGVSYWVSADPGVAPWDDRASATSLVQLAVNQSLPLCALLLLGSARVCMCCAGCERMCPQLAGC